jgi:predicted dehydrogenase
MELYGTDGTMDLPDPNFFGGDVEVTPRGEETQVQSWEHPLGVPNFEGTQANYRGAGLADMALAIAEGRPHRCNDTFATHVVEVMTAILESGESGTVITMTTTCDRPDVLDPDAARGLMA